MVEATVGTLAKLVGGTIRTGDDPGLVIRGVCDLRASAADRIAFVRDARAIDLARESTAGAMLVGEELDGVAAAQVVVDDPQLAFAKVALHFHPVEIATEHVVHPSAVVDETAEIKEPVRIGAGVVIGPGARIGAGTVLHPGVTVGANARIGERCVLHPRVALYDRVSLGARVVVHAGTVIGSDGFGYAPDFAKHAEMRWNKVPQVGVVTIGDDVEIGANTAIDRATMGETRIGRGTKIDNLVHIAHNCVVGEDCAIAGFVALAGSTTLGDRVTLAGHVVSAGHLKVTDDVRIGGNSVLTSDVREPGDYMGYPLQKRLRWGRTLHIVDHLVDLKGSLRALERGDD